MEGVKEIPESRSFNRFFFILSVFVFVIAIVRSIVVPFSNDESTTFFNYEQTGYISPYTSLLNNNHFLNSLLSWVCFRLFGDSTLSLRLPNLIGLIVLVVAVFRLSKRLTQPIAKAILVAGLLLSFHWLGFFSMCRGYGMSMAFVTLAFSYIPDYLENKKAGIFKIYLLLDLALCANLTLMSPIAIITALVFLYQIHHHRFFKIVNTIIWLFHLALLLFWIKYLLYMKSLDHLHSGIGGNSYWHVTFDSLITLITGMQNSCIAYIIVGICILITAIGLQYIIKIRKHIEEGRATFILFLMLLFNGLIVGAYLLNKLLGVDMPEDRTALIFYLLFIIYAAFIIESVHNNIPKFLAIPVWMIFIVHYAFNLNFSHHSLEMYSVIPNRYYNYLLEEQKHSPNRIAVKGSTYSEPVYNYLNYKHNGALNYMDYPDAMIMDADFYITEKPVMKYCLPYYQVIDSDKHSIFVLLKRIQPVTRRPVLNYDKCSAQMDTNSQYFNFCMLKDTAFNSHDPLSVEVNFKITEGEMPTFCWLVMSLDSAEGKTVCYKRIPLNKIKSNWVDGTSEDLILTTDVLPKRVHRLVCYLWNLRHQRLKVEVNYVRLFQLDGYGVDVSPSWPKSQ